MQKYILRQNCIFTLGLVEAGLLIFNRNTKQKRGRDIKIRKMGKRRKNEYKDKRRKKRNFLFFLSLFFYYCTTLLLLSILFSFNLFSFWILLHSSSISSCLFSCSPSCPFSPRFSDGGNSLLILKLFVLFHCINAENDIHE